MKKEQNKELLTSNLYLEISADKSAKIANLKEQKSKILAIIKERDEELKRLKIEKKEINNKIKIAKRALSENKNEKFSLTRQLGKQKKLANNLNKLITKEEPYISVDSFYPENITPKKR